jgi:hypothetical protein
MKNNDFNDRFLKARELAQHQDILAVMALNHQLGGCDNGMDLPPSEDISVIHFFTLWKQQKNKQPDRRGPSGPAFVENKNTQ